MKLDKTDREILRLLQLDAAIPLETLARAVHLTPTPTWRRIQKLEAAGVIRRRVALCDADKLGVGVTVFVSIKTAQHNAAWLEQFASGVRDIDEVVELYRMSGDVDYLMRIVVPDIAGYDAVYKRLIRVVELSDVSSSFAMERIKYTTALPVDYAAQG
ncbi:MAG: Lrp/AsnC family transcriptional regulator [Burkholderiaceae bacterium]